MPQSQFGPLSLTAKTSEVVDYHRDEARPGKPLHVLIPGGLIALSALALIIWVAYMTWYDGSLPRDTGLRYVFLLAPAYVGGVFLFSYGYELYDMPKALRLTAVIALVSVAAVLIVGVLFSLLGKARSGSSSDSDSDTDSSSDIVAGFFSRGSSRRRWGGSGGWGTIDLNFGGSYQGGGFQPIGAEEDVAPALPLPITCQFCGRSFAALDSDYVCPGCGAAVPKDAP